MRLHSTGYFSLRITSTVYLLIRKSLGKYHILSIIISSLNRFSWGGNRSEKTNENSSNRSMKPLEMCVRWVIVWNLWKYLPLDWYIEDYLAICCVGFLFFEGCGFSFIFWFFYNIIIFVDYNINLRNLLPWDLIISGFIGKYIIQF